MAEAMQKTSETRKTTTTTTTTAAVTSTVVPVTTDAAAAAASSDDEKSEWKTAFDWLDKDCDGMISVKDLNAAMRQCGYEVTEADLQDTIREIDADANGTVDWEEFQVLMVRKTQHFPLNQTEMLRAFQLFDTDRDGFIAHSELKSAVDQFLGCHLTDKEVDEMIADVDADGDGRISFSEFEQMMNRPYTG